MQGSIDMNLERIGFKLNKRRDMGKITGEVTIDGKRGTGHRQKV